MTKKLIPEPLLALFSDFLARRMGLYFPRERWPDMVRGLERAAPEFGLHGAAACMRWLLATPLDRARVETLAGHLTVGETYFYREHVVFAALEQVVLPAMIAARRAAGQLQLRIWSAGCCTGEEAYSVAVLLNRLIPDIDQWNIDLIGTDINPHFLARAKRAVYREWSFRDTPAWFREGYFSQCGDGQYSPAPHIRRLASFACHNLVDEVSPAFPMNGAVDLVLCRNVLMYFEPDAVRAVLNKFRRALVEGGWLVVSPTEGNAAQLCGFAPVRFGDTTFYRNDAEPALPFFSAPPALEVAALLAPPLPDPRREERTSFSIEMPLPQTVKLPAARDAESAYREALTSYAGGDYAVAIATLTAETLDEARGLTLAARACANLGRLDEAGRWCAAAVAADKVNPGLRFLQASIFIELKEYQPAAAALKQALYLDHDFVLAHFALGNLYLRFGQRMSAVRHLAVARELLAGYLPDQALPEGDGLTAGGLLDIIDHVECLA